MYSDLYILTVSSAAAFFYAIVIFLASPYKSIDLKCATNYIVAGGVSAFLVLAFQRVFPGWSQLWSYDPLILFFSLAFVQVAFLEETCKFICYRLFSVCCTSKKDLSSMSIMYYTTLVGVGFAIVENIINFRAYGNASIIARSFSAVIAHMICGLLLGYFIALGKRKSEVKSHSEFSRFFIKRPTIKGMTYTFIGLMVAIAYHGIYDFNLMYHTEYSLLFKYVILISGLALVRYMFNHAREHYLEDLKETTLES